jgi:hypothetical protein
VSVKIIYVSYKDHTLPVLHSVTLYNDGSEEGPEFSTFNVKGSTSHKIVRYLVLSGKEPKWMSEGQIVREFGKKVFKRIKKEYFQNFDKSSDEGSNEQ